MTTKKSATSNKKAPTGLKSLGIDLSDFDELLPSITVADAAKGLASEIRQALMVGTVGQLARHAQLRREAVELAYLFHKSPRQFKTWFDQWKEAPDYEFFCRLIEASNYEGVVRFQERNAAKKHARNRDASSKLPDLWEKKKREGKTKNGAKVEIAKELNLSPGTVRKKLQGL